jgi:hypothetical protein
MHPVFKYFELDNHGYTCSLLKKSKCCNTRFKDNHSGNLVRHLQRFHVVEYSKVIGELNLRKIQTSENMVSKSSTKPKIINVKLKEEDIKSGLIEMVTNNGRPFAALNDSGFLKIMRPILDAFDGSIKTDPEWIKQHISNGAKEVRLKIEEIFKDKMISLKFDLATRVGRHFLGVNAQHIINGKIKIYTLGVVEMHEKATAENLEYKLDSILRSYKIKKSNIYSHTIDNGANMLATVNKFKKSLNFEIEDELFSTIIEEESVDSQSLMDLSRCSASNDEEIGDISKLHEDFNEIMEKNRLYSETNNLVRCAAHTIQLAVWDLLKDKIVKKVS